MVPKTPSRGFAGGVGAAARSVLLALRGVRGVFSDFRAETVVLRLGPEAERERDPGDPLEGGRFRAPARDLSLPPALITKFICGDDFRLQIRIVKQAAQLTTGDNGCNKWAWVIHMPF